MGLQLGCKLVDGHPLLLAGIPVAEGDGVVLECIEVNRDTVWGANLVLATVALADVAVVVKECLRDVLLYRTEYRTCLFNKFWFVLQEWEYGRFVWCKMLWELHNGTRFTIHGVLGVRGY
jgi:hypothetical protein